MSDVSRAYRSRCGRHTAVLLPSALTLMMLMLAIASRADALVYWSNSPAFAGPGSIGRASLDGTDVDQAFIHSADLLGDPAVDGSHIYWVKVDLAPFGCDPFEDPECHDNSWIARGDLDGSNLDASFLSAGVHAAGVAIDATHVYWTADGTIGRADLDGTGADQNFITGASSPAGVAVDGSHVYWANMDSDTIGRADLDGTGADQNFITGASSPAGVAVDGSHVYWANMDSDTIGRADLDGTGADQNFITGASSPAGVAVDGSHVYWANMDSDTIGRADLDGTGADQNFITGASSPAGVAVDTLLNVPPNTTIGAGPSGPTNDPTPSFEFSSNETGAQFECRLDSSEEVDFQPCSSPNTVGHLSDGPHTFEVRAVDAGNVSDPTPASRTFTVDTQPPETQIDSGPDSLTADDSPTFDFSSGEQNVSFECQLNGNGYSPCSLTATPPAS